MKYIKLQYLSVMFMLAGGLLTACDEDIKIGQIDEDNYVTSNDRLGYISDNNGDRMFTTVEFRSQGNTSFYLNVPKESSTDNTITLTYDQSALDAYNSKNNSSYEAFPKEQVTLDAEGIIHLKAGTSKSSGLKVSYTSDGSLSANKSYVIPLRVKVTSGDLKLNENDATKFIFVKDLTGVPDCTKLVNGEPGVKVFSCMEVNDTNPLNNLSFTLKSNGKPLVDALIIFAANINYNPETGRVYILNNENVQALLDNRKHYLKPLQDKGMKIILGLLGNHDRSGISNLADATAKAFAQEVKAMCDAYQLDGIFVDDEYSNYQTPPPPGFVNPSSSAAARLCYEVKQAQPERWVIAYAYSSTYSLPSVDGIESGEFVDYALHDYGGSSDLSTSFPGMPKANMGLYSQEFNREYMASESSLREMRDDGYLSHMIFAMDPNRSNFTYAQLPAMQNMARAFYDDELVFDGIKYPKDWK